MIGDIGYKMLRLDENTVGNHRMAEKNSHVYEKKIAVSST